MTMVLLCLACFSCYAAWALAALANPAHWKAIGVLARLPHPSPLRMRGLACIHGAVSGGLCVARDGWGLGMLLWACMACVTALLVVLTLAWLNRTMDLELRRARELQLGSVAVLAHANGAKRAHKPRKWLRKEARR